MVDDDFEEEIYVVTGNQEKGKDDAVDIDAPIPVDNLREQRRDARAPVARRRERPPPKPSAAMLDTWLSSCSILDKN